MIKWYHNLKKSTSQVVWFLVTKDDISIESLLFGETILVHRFRYHTLKACFKPAMSLFSKSGLWNPSYFIWLLSPQILYQLWVFHTFKTYSMSHAVWMTYCMIRWITYESYDMHKSGLRYLINLRLQSCWWQQNRRQHLLIVTYPFCLQHPSPACESF